MLSTGEPEEDSTSRGVKGFERKGPARGQGEVIGSRPPLGRESAKCSLASELQAATSTAKLSPKKDGPAPAGPSLGLGTRLLRMGGKAWPSFSAAAGDARSTVICHNASLSRGPIEWRGLVPAGQAGGLHHMALFLSSGCGRRQALSAGYDPVSGRGEERRAEGLMR